MDAKQVITKFDNGQEIFRRQSVEVLVAKIRQLESQLETKSNAQRSYVGCPHGVWEEACEEHHKSETCSQGGTHEFIVLADSHLRKQCQKCNLIRTHFPQAYKAQEL